MPTTIEARCLIDEALVGTVNMARDAALLACRLQPTLRFYRWSKPTVSLGYFQPANDLPLEQFRQSGYDIVRRRTGGKAILHHHEQTYSLCFAESLFPGKGPAALMQMLHQILAEEIGRQMQQPVTMRRKQLLRSDQLGSPWCFEDSSALDLVVNQRKLLGSAARRSGGWVLFHGSLVLETPLETPEIAAMLQEPDLAAIQRAFATKMGWNFGDEGWKADELAVAEQVEKEFRAAQFLHRA